MLHIERILKLFINKNLYFIFISLITSYTAVTYISKDHTKYKKQYAIIFVPGLFNCGLFKLNKLDQTYQNMFFNKTNDIYNILTIEKDFQEKCDIIKCLSYGVPYHQSVTAIDKNQQCRIKEECDKNTAKYGIDMLFKTIINKVKDMIKNDKGYKKRYKVYMFNYDWRLGIKENGEKLANEIKKYNQTIIIAFSLGGLISSYSFSKLHNENLLNKVNGFIACGVPFLGSCNALYYLIGEINFNEYNIYQRTKMRFGIPKNNLLKLQETLRNYQSIYNLLPSNILESTEENTENNPILWSIRYIHNKDLLKKAKNTYNYIYKKKKWWETMDNIYIIYGTGHKTKLSLLSKSIYSNYDGDGTVTKISAYPEFLKRYVKKAYNANYTQHTNILLNTLVQEEIINNIRMILHTTILQNEDNDKKTK